MKNKLRAIANWILILTLPIWFLPTLVSITIYEIFFEKNEDRKSIARDLYSQAFIKGKEWFWE